ncbi:hypothetical protein JD276_14050 [Leucobacter sp. CSA1]|uniref:Uncharacterized protein n=1 Tax=Leucobacter chromiisoli TaxID=2796471 RepID=A0A934UW45_9MICO|nr:hypothetical protein [Leucobacter chromiisoli]MBK0420156.1 hypothetical protein [Leucobacter chromiisoli]
MTEIVEPSREELEAELAALRAQSTRDRSPVKPADHKPGKSDLVKVEYKGVEFEVKAGGMSSLRVLDALERNQFTTALRYLVGDQSFDRFLVDVPDADAEDAGKLLELIAEKAGAKNS